MKRKVFGYSYFTSKNGTIALVLYEDLEGEKRAGICLISGYDEIYDLKYVINWGAKFPAAIAETLVDRKFPEGKMI